MKKVKWLSQFLVIIVIVSSCKGNFLNVTPKSQLSSKSVWASSKNADLFLNDIYNNEPDFRNSFDQLLGQYTGFSYVGAEWMSARTTVYPGNISSTSEVYGPGNMWNWGTEYTRIRKCNVFIKNVENSKSIAQSYKNKRIPEAKFLRALFYSWLWENYGGVPIIKVPLNRQTQGKKIFRKRATQKETFQFIDNELSAIADSLPSDPANTQTGRPTKGAALTLKAWVELYEASPLFNPSDNKKLWQNAADTYKKVMNMGVYKLDPNFNDLYNPDTQGSNRSLIFQREYTKAKGGTAEGYRGVTMQGGVETGWGNWTPTQNLVDKFSMSNGKMINDPNSGYDPQHPYKNRSQRFYDTIVYDGSSWQGYKVTTRIGGNNEIDLGSQSDITNTGYYAKKSLDPNINEASNIRSHASPVNYVFFRYAGVLLGYAEAENEAEGPVPSVYQAVDKVRARVNLPSIEKTYGTVSQSKMRKIIHNEWDTEFAFENKSWYNLRRWKTSDTFFNKPLYGMKITEQNGSLQYNKVKLLDRSWQPYMDLMPIPNSVLSQNPVIKKQNGGPDN
ncbi:MAG TPA: RagB/SusD family nutrient uptake outer membrane protein, partial [Balneolaceae bacterium]|nr:RagB/SusD family nutrient uptake outer membrane protein [Balneolaceae bacterium]